jgi:hypothetical protein
MMVGRKGCAENLNVYVVNLIHAGTYFMILHWKEWNRNDIVYGIVVPILVVLLIVLISKLGVLFGGGFGVTYGITMEIEELVVIAGVPMVFGLLWNRWAGGASGFLMGSFYALYWANSFHGIPGSGTVLLAYILSAMLIGYVAGALSRSSQNFIRMAISGVTAGTIGGIMLFGIFQLSTANVVTGVEGFLLTVLTRTATGAVAAIIAKVFTWYGMTINKNASSL